MYAVPFDLDRLEAAGDAVSVVEGVIGTANTGGVQFSVADNGTLVYIAGRTDSLDARIYTMEASGNRPSFALRRLSGFTPAIPLTARSSRSRSARAPIPTSGSTNPSAT